MMSDRVGSRLVGSSMLELLYSGTPTIAPRRVDELLSIAVSMIKRKWRLDTPAANAFSLCYESASHPIHLFRSIDAFGAWPVPLFLFPCFDW